MLRSKQAVYQELLVRRCQSGQPEAFEELIGLWEKRLLYYIRRLVEHESDAWDVLQQTWVEVLGSIGKLRDSGALRPWLYAVARHVAASHYRPTLLQRAKTDTLADLEDVPEDNWVPRYDDALYVHESLAHLSVEHREVLVLHFLEGMCVQEIAAVVDVPAGTIRSRLYYAKRALRAILERERVS
ncbi:MAG TPA: RNA polymerase sigma factor [Tepidisphaeraceae bacterium]|nr:RNA polymerase sigma factor [Tepidisphaeraceae bacterium]